MKINAGCGLDYRPGYLNIDGFDNTVADRIMPLWNMDLPPACAEEVLARQVIEHLGFFRSKHFLSESFRILKPGGILIIETPDIENSFRQFIAANRVRREELTQWIFGLETTGMVHHFCFPAELLEETVVQSGFRMCSMERIASGSGNPSLRLTVRKEPSEPFEFMARFRREILSSGICSFDSETGSAARENLLMKLQSVIEQFHRHRNPAVLHQCMELSLENAELIHSFFILLAREQLLSETYAGCAAELCDFRFRKTLLGCITGRPLDSAEQEKGFAAACGLLRETVKKLLAGSRIEDCIESCSDADEYPDFDLSVINHQVLSEQSRRMYATGMKYLQAGQRAEAKNCFHQALKLFRNNPAVYERLSAL